MAPKALKQRVVKAVELAKLDARARARELAAYAVDPSIRMPAPLDARAPSVRIEWHNRV